MKSRLSLLLISAVFAMVSLSSTLALAQKDDRVDKLLDLLVNKGVITQDEAGVLKEELDAPGVTQADAPADVHIVSNVIKLKGFMNIAYYQRKNNTTQNSDTFSIRQARLTASGEPHPNYKFKLGVAFERNAPILTDAEIDYKLSPHTTLAMGQFKLPLSHESIISGKNIDLIDRSQFINQMRPENGRDIGLKFTHVVHDTQFEIGMFNGSGKNNLDSGDPDALVGRISGSYKVGDMELCPEIAYLSARTETGSATPIETSITATAGFEPYDKTLKQIGLRTRYGRLTYKAEYIEGRFSPKTNTIGSVRSDGIYHQLGWDFDSRYTMFWRYETYDPNLATTTNTDITWNTLALNYQARKNVLYKLNYLFKQEATGGVDDNELRLQATISF